MYYLVCWNWNHYSDHSFNLQHNDLFVMKFAPEPGQCSIFLLASCFYSCQMRPNIYDRGCFSLTRILLAPNKNLGTLKFDILECEYFFTKILIFKVIHVQNNFLFQNVFLQNVFFKVSIFYKMKENHYEKVNSGQNICNLGLV